MATFIIEVTEGPSDCDTCPFYNDFNCETKLQTVGIRCDKYDLSTLKITKQEE